MSGKIFKLITVFAFVPSVLMARRDSLAPTADNPVSIEAISDSLFGIIYGKSFKEETPFDRSELRHLKVLHYGFDGKEHSGELICNKDVASDLKEIFTELYENGYQIESLKLIDEFDADDIKSMEANNSSSFNFRRIGGSQKLSKHATGRAVDINPLYNPYVKGDFVSPESGRPYADRNAQFAHKIDRGDLACKLFLKHGWTWGGDWNSCKDYQHFEK